MLHRAKICGRLETGGSKSTKKPIATTKIYYFKNNFTAIKSLALIKLFKQYFIALKIQLNKTKKCTHINTFL